MALVKSCLSSTGTRIDEVIIGSTSQNAGLVFPKSEVAKIAKITVSVVAGSVGGDGVKIVHGNAIDSSNTYWGLTTVNSAIGDIVLSSYTDNYVGIAIDCSGNSTFKVAIEYA